MGNETAIGGRVEAAEAAGFVSDVDLNRVSSGATFKATWSFTNRGTTTWNGQYRLAYTTTPHAETANNPRSPMTAQSSWAITDLGAPAEVRPGETVALTLSLTAPSEPGTHATNWQLQAPDGQRFGPIRWLRAVVVAGTSPTPGSPFTYQFVSFANSVANFNNVRPGQQFSGTWTVRNTGATVWPADLQVAYVDQASKDTQNVMRNQMGAPAVSTLRERSGRERVNPGETVAIRLDLVAPTQPGGYAFHWQLRDQNGRPFGTPFWLRIGVSGDVDTTPETPGRAVQFGMNVNPNTGGHPLDAERLAGLGWVRYVYWASREERSPEEAYQQVYRHKIQTYASQGIRSLLILHQDTYWGNAPWDNGGWEAYAENFGRECGRVAKMCAEFGDMVAYQVYNEQDSKFGDDAGNDNPSAIGIAPEHYAQVLKHASQALRAAHPGCKVIFGGMKTGAGNAVRYAREVQKHIGGELPVDALAYHPYGAFVKSAPFNFKDFGTLSNALLKVKAAFPQHPLWITEVGVAADNPNPFKPEHYPLIATYMREVVEEVATKFSNYVQVLIWFGWTDLMRNAGMNLLDNQPKPHVYDAFLAMRDRGKSVTKSVTNLLAEVAEATFVSYTSTVTNANAVPAGESFTSRWTFKNSGTATWGDGYKLVYSPKGPNPAAMTAQTSYPLSQVASRLPVEPDETVEISLNLTAPERAGRTYRSQWQLRDAKGKAFGFMYEEVTVVPASTAGSGARAAGMTFISDQTIPDQTPLVAGSDFEKQWQVKNTGGRQWGPGFRLVFVEGDLQMARGVSAHMVPTAEPNAVVTLSVPMTVPPARDGAATLYKSMWRMQDDRGNWFGDPVWVVIVATSGLSPTPGGNTALARLLNDPSLWYSQLNTTWANETLGHGQAKMEAWGCLVNCMAMVLSAFGTRVNPQELNQRLLAFGNQGFVGSDVQFIAPLHAGGLKHDGNFRSWPDSDIAFSKWTGEDPIQRIDKALAAGQIVIAQVDTKPNNGFYNNNNEQHWVVLVKRTPAGDDYLMIDPLLPTQHALTQPRSLMAKYGNPLPSNSHSDNLRNAIKSVLIYYKTAGSGN